MKKFGDARDYWNREDWIGVLGRLRHKIELAEKTKVHIELVPSWRNGVKEIEAVLYGGQLTLAV